MPLQKNLGEKAQEIFNLYKKCFPCDYDEAGSIGKRYRRQDEVGTPYCVTIDFETLDNGTVTLRDRDSMEQIRLKIEDVIPYVESRIKFN